MLSAFKLAPGVDIDTFRQALEKFEQHMMEAGLLEACGKIGRRQRHPVMDTDEERDQEFYFVMSFRDRDQCDQAVACIKQGQEPGKHIHRDVYSSIADGIFTCWEDLPG